MTWLSRFGFNRDPVPRSTVVLSEAESVRRLNAHAVHLRKERDALRVKLDESMANIRLLEIECEGLHKIIERDRLRVEAETKHFAREIAREAEASRAANSAGQHRGPSYEY